MSGTEQRGLVTVKSGVFSYEVPAAGMTVGETRAKLFERMNLQPDMTNQVDGEPAEDSTVLAEGQELCFIRPTCCKC